MVAAVAIAAQVGCRSSTNDNGGGTDGSTAELPQGTSCSSFAIACYDEFAEESAGLINFRPTSRWNKTDLTWRLAAPLPQFSAQDQLDVIERALTMWSDVSTLSFSRVDEDDETADISISFADGTHGDPFPFDGAGNVLGHAFFPGTAQAGAVHLCGAEDWGIEGNTGTFDLFTVVLHELGHALGLEHSEDENAVMAPSYHVAANDPLTESDIAAIQSLYGSADGSVAPTASGTPGLFTRAPDAVSANDPDSDGDGIPDSVEVFVLDTDPFNADSDEDGSGDFDEVFVKGTPPADATTTGDLDVDGDGLSATREALLGTDPQDFDSDDDGLHDGVEINFFGTDPLDPDSDDDGIRDGIDVFPTNPRFVESTAAPIQDCNDNDVGDAIDILNGTSEDCNRNNVPDECELSTGDLQDQDGDGVPDSCAFADCNGNDRADTIDIAIHFSRDCNGNQTPDECDIASGTQTDSDDDGILDACVGADCDGDGVPDVIEIDDGTAGDCNSNGLPDDCETAPLVETVVQGAPLLDPTDVFYDMIRDETLIADAQAKTVFRVAPDSTISTFASDTRFGDLGRIALEPGTSNVLITDLLNATIWRITPIGVVSVFLEGPPLFKPTGIAVDMATNEVYVTDGGGPVPNPPARVLRYDGQSMTVEAEGGPLRRPVDIVILPDSDRLIVVDQDTSGLLDIVGGIPTVMISAPQLSGASAVIPGPLPGDYVVATPSGLFRVIDEGLAVEPMYTGPPFVEIEGFAPRSNSRSVLIVDPGAQALFEFALPNDCDANRRPDICDIGSGLLEDCDANGVPDECEFADMDCNANGIPDPCEILSGDAVDANQDGRPDECP